MAWGSSSPRQGRQRGRPSLLRWQRVNNARKWAFGWRDLGAIDRHGSVSDALQPPLAPGQLLLAFVAAPYQPPAARRSAAQHPSPGAPRPTRGGGGGGAQGKRAGDDADRHSNGLQGLLSPGWPPAATPPALTAAHNVCIPRGPRPVARQVRSCGSGGLWCTAGRALSNACNCCACLRSHAHRASRYGRPGHSHSEGNACCRHRRVPAARRLPPFYLATDRVSGIGCSTAAAAPGSRWPRGWR